MTYLLSETEHRYGSNVHLLEDPVLQTQLATLCSETTTQPLINELIHEIYSAFLKTVLNQELPLKTSNIRTRMHHEHPEAVLRLPVIDPETQAVVVNLARAGTLPSQICYQMLNYLLNPQGVRQDHISISRAAGVSGHKIGGSVQDAILLFPDPMGATGGTIVQAIELYQKLGRPTKTIAMHCIITPEYLKFVQTHAPGLIIYALRLDRGLSPPDVLNTKPGTHWDRERGLNSHHYIIPGGGGFGEILNNAYV